MAKLSTTIPGVRVASASTAAAGLVDTSAQSFAGLKTFQDGVTVPTSGSSGNAFSGTYTPVPVAPSNCTATCPQPFRYIRVGNTVFVSGIALATATASAACSFQLNLPIASNITHYMQCSGTVSHAQVGQLYAPGGVYGDSGNDRAEIVWRSNGDANQREVYIHFSYTVQ